MTETQNTIPESTVREATWRVGKWGNGSTPDGMAIIFCDAWETAITLDALPERMTRIIVDAHNEALAAARKECAEIARLKAALQKIKDVNFPGWEAQTAVDYCRSIAQIALDTKEK